MPSPAHDPRVFPSPPCRMRVRDVSEAPPSPAVLEWREYQQRRLAHIVRWNWRGECWIEDDGTMPYRPFPTE